VPARADCRPVRIGPRYACALVWSCICLRVFGLVRVTASERRKKKKHRTDAQPAQQTGQVPKEESGPRGGVVGLYPEVLSSSCKFLTTDFAILPQSAFARNPMHLQRGGIAQRIRYHWL
jgi:hypothetical protein